MTLLLLAAAAVAVLHAVLPDHWVPLAVVARTQRWSWPRLVRVCGIAASGHVMASLLLAAVVALVGLRLQDVIDRDQGRIVGGLLIVTGLAFLVWSLTHRGHHLETGIHEHRHAHAEAHEHQHAVAGARAHHHPHASTHAHQHPVDPGQRWGGRLAVVAVPFGVAASPDLTILPVALAAGAYGLASTAGVLAVFAAVTMAVFVGLTLAGAWLGYQMRAEWLERHASTVTAGVLIAVGAVAFAGL